MNLPRWFGFDAAKRDASAVVVSVQASPLRLVANVTIGQDAVDAMNRLNQIVKETAVSMADFRAVLDSLAPPRRDHGDVQDPDSPTPALDRIATGLSRRWQAATGLQTFVSPYPGREPPFCGVCGQRCVNEYALGTEYVDQPVTLCGDCEPDLIDYCSSMGAEPDPEHGVLRPHLVQRWLRMVT